MSVFFSISEGVFEPLDTLIAVLSELEEGKEKPAAENRKIGCDEKKKFMGAKWKGLEERKRNDYQC